MARGSVSLLVLLFIAWSGSLAAQDPSEPEVESVSPRGRSLDEARAAFEQGDLPRAEQLYRTAIQSGAVEGWRGIADVRRHEGDLEGAADALWQFYGAQPHNDAAKRELAALLCRLPGHEWEAFPLSAELVEQFPRDPALRLQLARMQSILGWHRQARENYTLAAELADDPAVARDAELGLAGDYTRAGERHRAAEVFQRHLEGEGRVPALRGLADLEYRQGRPAAAAELYRQVLDNDPDDFEARERLGQAEARQSPRLFAQGQSYSDNADWTRTKFLGGVDFALTTDWRLRVAWENAEFEDAAGRDLQRDSLLLRGDWRPDAFVSVGLDLQAGNEGGDADPRGGLSLLYEPTEWAVVRAGYRHDQFLDPIDPFAFDRRNDALDTRLLSREEMQSDTFHAAASYAPPGALGFAGAVEGGTMQDKNNRSRMHLQLHFPVELAPGWRFTPRTFYARKHYQSASTLYFSPSNLESWGGGGELSCWDFAQTRQFFADFATFYQPSGVSEWGYQADAGFRQQLGDASSLELRFSWLSSPERAPGPTLRSTAILAGFAIAF